MEKYGIIKALRKRYEADVAAAIANIEVYDSNPAGIGDHADIVSAVDCEVVKLSEAVDKIEALKEEWQNDQKQFKNISSKFLLY